ncbi:PP2C family protein-serine/threonine phosphatase [Actinokineospora sp. HUAS TT18]|uniref:PP2C family protein-serine/threonine phosphatase n=1 Tax=Actinokineospora sp. HUAS TT18 TaxID=3447451 RepID=UPI003F5266AC
MKGLEAAAGSTVGTRYSANFDVAHLALDPLVAVVADGMGDGEGSALAGRTAVDTFVELAAPDPRALVSAVMAAQERVREIGRRVAGLAGCTLTALVAGDGLWITQVGDSRVYRLRSGLLELGPHDGLAWCCPWVVSVRLNAGRGGAVSAGPVCRPSRASGAGRSACRAAGG